MSTSWPTACGSQVNNPFCLQGTPTDPYNWFYYNDKWTYASLWTTAGPSGPNAAVVYYGQIYLCTGPGACTGPPVDGVNGWSALSTLQAADPQYANSMQLQCTGPSLVGPPPNPITGACETSATSGPAAACVNPCIRLANGQLAVNKLTSQCRVFPGTTDGGSAVTVSGAIGCPTVCPQACVELWDTCPPGTAPLTTLIQTKTVDDVMALAGPYQADGSINALWPANYYRSDQGVPPIGGKSYTECYSYNTEFCELPGAFQVTASGAGPSPLGSPGTPMTMCYANCPPGTFRDPNSAFACLFVPLGGSQYDPSNPTAYNPTVPVQKIFCNPQYYNPVYWDAQAYPGFGGVQKGCQSKPLPAKQGTTCVSGTLPIINENFNLEWCMPQCPSGYVPDITQSTCLATCEGAGNTTGQSNSVGLTQSVYNPFLDYHDFYATTNRCLEVNYTTNGTTVKLEVDCAQNYVPGRCPAVQHAPVNSTIFQFNTNTPVQDVRVKVGSINTQCADRQFKEWKTSGGLGGLSRTEYLAYKSYLDSLAQYQEAHQRGPNKMSAFYNVDTQPDENQYGECPTGMVFGAASCDEAPGLCYDECMSGYEPVTFCSNGAKNCGPQETVFACRALCPSPDEGLGPWREVSEAPVFACAYDYPQGVAPTDPNLFVQCPDDGRFYTLTSSPTDISLTQSAAERTPPLCVRNTYLRHVTCPNGFNASTDIVTLLTKCNKACDASESVVLSGNDYVCQGTTSDQTRFDVDLTAVADGPLTKPQFRHRVLRRKNFVRARGADPNIALPDPSVNPTPSQFAPLATYGSVGVAVVAGIFLFKSLIK